MTIPALLALTLGAAVYAVGLGALAGRALRERLGR